MRYHLDYETYSEADISTVGSAKYAQHYSTHILLAAIAGEDGVVHVWQNPRVTLTAADPKAIALLEQAFTSPDSEIWAFSYMFEAFITEARAEIDLNLPPPKPHQWRCTQAVARRAAMPDSLAKLSEALNLTTKKDAKGSALIKLFCMPFVPRAKRGAPPAPARRIYPSEFPAQWDAFVSYNRTDVLAEMEAHERLKPFVFKGALLKTFLADWDLNRRGFLVDTQALTTAAQLIETESSELLTEFVAKYSCNPTQRAVVRGKLAGLGLIFKNMTSATIADAVQTATGPAADLLRLYSKIQYSAAKKVTAMLDTACEDNRVRGAFQFYGARSGRWSGRGVQPQNFKKSDGVKGEAEEVYSYFQSPTSDLSAFPVLFGGASELAARHIRRFVRGPFLDYDYSAIEARVNVWVAGQDDIVKDFANGVDVYRNMGADIYGIPADSIKDKSPEYKLGKVSILGAGYGMGPDKFFTTCNDVFGLNVSKELAAKAIGTFREKFHKVRDLWYALDRGAKEAIANPDQWVTVKKVQFMCTVVSGIRYLILRLPSGRGIVYPHPEINNVFKASFGKHIDELSFWGPIPGKAVWGRISTYGGKLCENACQGIAADVMAQGLVAAADAGFEPEMLVHDQMLARDPKGLGEDLLKRCMTELPAWGKGLPLNVKGGPEEFYT